MCNFKDDSVSKKELDRLNKLVQYLRRELLNPPPDVQEKVLHDLNIYQSFVDYNATIRKLEEELERLRVNG